MGKPFNPVLGYIFCKPFSTISPLIFNIFDFLKFIKKIDYVV